jgi:hypothetical protein
MIIIGRRAQRLSGLTWRATQVQDPHIKNVVAKYHWGRESEWRRRAENFCSFELITNRRTYKKCKNFSTGAGIPLPFFRFFPLFQYVKATYRCAIDVNWICSWSVRKLLIPSIFIIQQGNHSCILSEFFLIKVQRISITTTRTHTTTQHSI